jgi:hypothetical protein
METMMRTRFIRRPARSRGPGRPSAGYPYAELLQTLDTRQAVLLPGPRTDLTKPVNSMRRKMDRLGYRVRTADHPEGLALWIERRADPPAVGKAPK